MLSFILKFNKLQFLSVIPLRHENAPLLEPEWKEVIAVIAAAALAAAFFFFFLHLYVWLELLITRIPS